MDSAAPRFNLGCGGCGRCYVCGRIRSDPRVAEAFGAPPALDLDVSRVNGRTLPMAIRAPQTCRHSGALTRRTQCPSCNGRVEVKVFGCAKHGECQAIATL